MTAKVVVVGGGVGGLTAATRLAQAGTEVTLLEATGSVGGLARSLDIDDRRVDGGPYLLLDRAGLDWAFAQLGLALGDALALTRVERVYRVEAAGAPAVQIDANLEATAAGLDHDFPGAGRRYVRFIEHTRRVYATLSPLLVREHSRTALLATGAIWHAPMLLGSLRSVLRRSGLPEPVIQALGIWTAIAGQELDEAPSPLAFVPALIHSAGCFVPRGGVGAVVDVLAGAAKAAGVRIQTGRRALRIEVQNRRATGVVTDGETFPADVVVSGAAGASTLLELTDPPPRLARRIRALPMQSPGLALFGVSDRSTDGPYLVFQRTPAHRQLPCKLVIHPARVHAMVGPAPIRVLAPLRQGAAGSEPDMLALADELRRDPWIASTVPGFIPKHTLTPAGYGQANTLYHDTMNPVMTARFMRQGRLPRRAPGIARLYLVGSATHPGQWVSFAAISGVL
ncbi:MAG TPA: NAD(P)/FAD-dependent oxidoreductase, partial [Kofleriaceae bacterium]|nr:NAD(P)/FAD-dependent oxidoreductase [Kofleriaceae bacterium]